MTTGTPDPSTRPRRPQGRSRVRTAVLLTVAVWAVLEIWLLTVVAHAVGGGTVLLLLLAGLVLGGIAVKRAGRRAWQSLTASARSGQPVPGAGAGGAGLAMLGGLLLMVPGFVSDAVGLLYLFPPTRKLLAAGAGALTRRLGARQYPPGSFGDAFQQARMRMPDGKVVPGEVVRDDHPSGAHPGGGQDGPPRGRLPR
ncbi:FxsA family membrane protein [Streptomyces sp. ICBB 8177]|uniref:FxsA family membrane protein n=1 Tax=Streptomyces sp. ICBB 8177 TaxID=563922 RepID=UPI000D67994C|nr:FxsA family membrane protein [Streptomyces sp. ICBB 8177]PWI42198.1 hypothetical protein CK485_25940 [Streptomyces sp. ICBB 8177]